jgi:D-aspartate ligase
MNSPQKVPAVVVGGNLNALGVIRSLSRGGMPIYILETTRRQPAVWSRHARFVRTASLSDDSLIEALVRLSNSVSGTPVLFLTSDQHVSAVNAHRAQIETRFRIAMPDPDLVNSLIDKVLFHQLAESKGIPVPRSVCLSRASPEGAAKLKTLVPPLVLKPADKILVLAGAAPRAVYASSLSEAQAAASAMMTSVPEVIAQEWIAGPDTELLFCLFTCDRHSNLLGAFAGRKLVCDPPAIGGTAVCVPAPEVMNELLPITREFVTTMRYQGLGSLEFKRDGSSGRILVIEPTVCRTDWQEEVATLNGVNLPLWTYLSEVGQTVPEPAATPLNLAWCATRAYAAGAPADTHKIDAVFRWSDIKPAIYQYGFENGLVPILHRAWRMIFRKGLSTVAVP